MTAGVVFALRIPGTNEPEYRVAFAGRVCSPAWLDRGPAQAYLDALQAGTREPEYACPASR